MIVTGGNDRSKALRLGQEAIAATMEGRSLGLLPSVLKLATSVTSQHVAEIALDAVGERLAPRFRPTDASGPNAEAPGIEWVQNYMYGRVRTIYGGSSEVQKNVIAKQLFGS